MIEEAIAKITAQQPKERTAVWMVGEQLKDILRGEPHLAELVLQDLEVESMSLAKCEAQIKAYADRHKTGSFSCVTPDEGERIIRGFYGLTAGEEELPAAQGGKILNLADFL